MNSQKVCEYLSDIGVLLFDNIDLFFQIHSAKKNNQFKNEPEHLKDSLFLYLQKTTKNENLLRSMSKKLIESYYNSHTIINYMNIKNLVNILQNKLLHNYNNVIMSILKYIANNKENKMKKTNSDDFIFRKSNENSPKKVIKKAKSKPKKRLPRPKKTNQYKNNYYKNIQETNYNGPHSFFVNNNDFYLNMYTNDINNPYNENPNLSTENFDNNIYNNENIVSYKYYSPMVNIQSKKEINNYVQNDDDNINNQNKLLINNNMNNNLEKYNMINNNENNMEMIPQQYNQFERPDYLNGNIDFGVPDDYDFFDNEEKHLQKVQNKIMNLKNEKITKLEEQCTFTPQINTNYTIAPRNINNMNTFEKLYMDSTNIKKKKEDKIKKYLDELTFQPNIEYNDKYRVKSTFEQRNFNSKNKKKEKEEKEEKKMKETSKKKKKLDEKEKEIINRLYEPAVKKINEEKKRKEEEEKKRKKVIDWKKVYKIYGRNDPESDYYKRQLEKRKKLLENLSSNKDKEDKKNNIMNFNDFLKEKEQNNKNENDMNNNINEQNNHVNENNINNILQSNIDNKEDNKEDKKEDDKEDNNEVNNDKNSVQEVQEAINEAYKSTSIKNLLNNNNLFKND